ncbi:MAG TPA: cytochrome c3 family protein [Steroidobacteraceae bacterium]|nr:cytochrome c3 family protein [Steroidobacteraceae bacterium]
MGRGLDARFRLWLAAMLALATLPLFAQFAGLAWELAQGAGLLSFIGCILLCGAPVRPRAAEPPTLLSLRAHAWLGWAALLAALVHIAGLVLADHIVIEYLKPSMPLYAWAGLLATVLLLLLVLSALSGARRRLFRNNASFQVLHVMASCALLALIGAHVITTHRYLGGPARTVCAIAASAAAMLMLLRARRGAASAAPGRGLVFGRSAAAIVATMALVVLSLIGMSGDRARAGLREPLVARTTTLPLAFPHEKHGRVNCLQCHHNYADGTGLDWCIHCHRSGRADLKQGVEARFHGFCLQCHRHPPRTLEGHGPVSGCATCHRTPDHVGLPAGAAAALAPIPR